MKQGTTPTHTFLLPFETSNIKALEITYAQQDTVILKKNLDACVLDGKVVTIELSQEDTFLFDTTTAVQMQLRVLTTTDQAYATEIYIGKVAKSLSKEVLK